MFREIRTHILFHKLSIQNQSNDGFFFIRTEQELGVIHQSLSVHIINNKIKILLLIS